MSDRVFRRFFALLFIITACLMMWPITQAFSSCADSSSLSVNGKSAKTGQVIQVSSRDIEIKTYFERAATDYRICENADFKGPGSDWKSLSGERGALTVKYTLSEGSGRKTVYFQAKRNSTEGTVVRIQLELPQ